MFTKKRDPDKPKKPATAYFLFLEDFRKKMKGIPLEPGKRLTVICGEEWNKLTDQQKKPYQDQVAIKYQLYEEAMREWRLKVRMSDHCRLGWTFLTWWEGVVWGGGGGLREA